MFKLTLTKTPECEDENVIMLTPDGALIGFDPFGSIISSSAGCKDIGKLFHFGPLLNRLMSIEESYVTFSHSVDDDSYAEGEFLYMGDWVQFHIDMATALNLHRKYKDKTLPCESFGKYYVKCQNSDGILRGVTAEIMYMIIDAVIEMNLASENLIDEVFLAENEENVYVPKI